MSWSRLLPCPECAGEREFEQPPCVDGHGVDCPDWLCTVCGTGLVAGVAAAGWSAAAPAGRADAA